MTRHKPVPGHEVKQHVYGSNCFGCGPDNQGGLHLEFHLNEAHKRFVCEFVLPQRFEGPPMHAHGGIIATILDEAMGKVSKLRSIIAVTGTMQVNYIRPVPLAVQLVTEGWVHRSRPGPHVGEVPQGARERRYLTPKNLILSQHMRLCFETQ